MKESANGEPLHPRSIDLNADLGEGFPNDRALLELVTSASICCGAHAGNDDVIRRTLAAAVEFDVVVGAHPGYPDREGFGRREQKMSGEEIRALILEQLGIIDALAADAGLTVRFLKPHGTLYNQAQKQTEIAQGVIASMESRDAMPLLGQPGSMLERMAASRSRPYIPEGFPDRRYRADGSLVPRGELDAVLHDPVEIEAQVLRLVHGGRVRTLCIHGDDPRAVANVELVRRILTQHGISIRSFVDKTS